MEYTIMIKYIFNSGGGSIESQYLSKSTNNQINITLVKVEVTQ